MFCTKILLAFDGSGLSNKALDMAIEIAKTDQVIELHVRHVVQCPIRPSNFYIPMDEHWYEREMQYGNEIAKNAEKKLNGLVNPYTVSVTAGSPGEEIVRISHELQCDLIIMGSRGFTGLKEFFLGSVSHYVTQNSKIPVLIVK